MSTMLLQNSAFSCGAYAMHSCFLAMGYDYDVETLAKMAKTDPVNGTYEEDVIKACLKLKHPCKEIQYYDYGYSLVELRGVLAYGGAAMLAVDGDSHWIAAIGTNGPERIIINDSAAGVSSLNTKDLLVRWAVHGKSRTRFYGIAILPR